MSAANKFPLPETIQDKEMMLPRRFMKNFKAEFSGSELTMEVADGRIWTVGLEEEEGYPNRVWLVPGFERFYSISPKQILLFRYLEPSRLKVFILRSTSMEITYPLLAPTPDSSELLDRLKKMKKMQLSNKFNLAFETMSTNSKRAVERALEEMNPANISTLVVIASYHIRPGNMYLPVNFTKKLCSRDDSTTARLKLYEGTDQVVGEWPIEFNKLRSQRNQKNVTGWNKFRRENELVEGDVCLFELIPRSEGEILLLKVRIVRAAAE